MTVLDLPPTPAAFAKATWDDIASFYDELAERALTAESVEAWLQAWSTLEELLTEAAALAMIAYTIDTGDAAKAADHLRFSTEVLPRAEERSVALARRLIDSGFTRPDMETTIRRFRTASEIFREANVPIFAEVEEHAATYQRITGSMTAVWDGVELPLPQLQPFLKSADRSVRERAWRSVTGPYIAQRDTLASLFDTLFELRQRAAANAGFANYRDYSFPSKFRFDYTPADCERFHDAVEQSFVPAVERIYAERRRRLVLDELRPWDLQVEPQRNEPLRPFATERELLQRGRAVFERVAPELGAEFQRMIDERLLDLASRKGKAPGGYCETLHFRGRPFIFMNAVGLVDDVNTLLHEAGHAFHAFASHPLPLIWQRHPGSEAAELASMSMELLAAPQLAGPGGFYGDAEGRLAEIEHLEEILIAVPHIASVDAYQHWLYTSGHGHDCRARDAAWLRIRARFERGVDWSGLEQERVARWYRQLHIFLYPFYYIEYGLAQLGALQVWRNSLRDLPGAVRRYREALALGATRSLPDTYAIAGASLTFDAPTMGALVAQVEERIALLRAGLPERG